jgi:hypothetical protein
MLLVYQCANQRITADYKNKTWYGLEGGFNLKTGVILKILEILYDNCVLSSIW